MHSAMKRLSRLTLKVVALPGGIHGYRTTRDGLRQLAQEMCKRPDSLDHLTAKAEMARRAAVQDRRRSWIMLASAVIAAIAATASALSAYFSYLQTLPYPVFWLVAHGTYRSERSLAVAPGYGPQAQPGVGGPGQAEKDPGRFLAVLAVNSSAEW